MANSFFRLAKQWRGQAKGLPALPAPWKSQGFRPTTPVRPQSIVLLPVPSRTRGSASPRGKRKGRASARPCGRKTSGALQKNPTPSKSAAEENRNHRSVSSSSLSSSGGLYTAGRHPRAIVHGDGNGKNTGEIRVFSLISRVGGTGAEKEGAGWAERLARSARFSTNIRSTCGGRGRGRRGDGAEPLRRSGGRDGGTGTIRGGG